MKTAHSAATDDAGQHAIPSVRSQDDADGGVTHQVAAPPEALPAVRRRDLTAAWEAARDAAGDPTVGPEAKRRFVFARPDGTVTELAVIDRDAQCWAGAVESVAALQTGYGVSLCLRLLALVDLLARAPWATRLLAFEAGLARVHPALLRLAASAPLSPDASFDEARFRDSLVAIPILVSGDPL